MKKTVYKSAQMLYNILCCGVWLSLVERFVRDEEAVGSNPVTPTITVNSAEQKRKTKINQNKCF